MRFVIYSLIGALIGGSIGAAGGFFGWIEYARIKKIDGVGIALGAGYFGFFLMLILGALGIAIGAWRAWLLRRRTTT